MVVNSCGCWWSFLVGVMVFSCGCCGSGDGGCGLFLLFLWQSFCCLLLRVAMVVCCGFCRRLRLLVCLLNGAVAVVVGCRY